MLTVLVDEPARQNTSSFRVAGHSVSVSSEVEALSVKKAPHSSAVVVSFGWLVMEYKDDHHILQQT